MIYDAYQAQADLLAPFRAVAGLASAAMRRTEGGPAANFLFRTMSAGAELVSRAQLTHQRPHFGIDSISAGGRSVRVVEVEEHSLPFGSLLHFRKVPHINLPRVLLVAPMAGHFPTLLRQTAEALLPDHDVYVTDWKNARDIPRSEGCFGFDEYISYLIDFLQRIGPDAHVVGVCQPCAALLAAVSLMAQNCDTNLPRTMTLMAGPIDSRINPTKVNRLATERSIAWFERHVIATVPRRFAGAHRRVYPGFLQVAAFLSMNVSRHLRAHLDLVDHIIRGYDDRAGSMRAFYDEYFSVFDLPGEFYLETVERVFQRHLLARGRLEYRGVAIDPGAIARTSLLTVEGERDDICSPGQTRAAHDLCTGLPASAKRQHLEPQAGHYGVFAGSRWRTGIYPVLRDFIAEHERRPSTRRHVLNIFRPHG